MSISVIENTVASAGNSAEFVLLTNTSKKQRIHFDTIEVLAVTDATVANRSVRLKVWNAKGVCTAAITSFVQTASNTVRHTFTRSCNSFLDGYVDKAYCLPKLWLDPYEYVTLTIQNGVAGDSITTTVHAYNEKVAFTL